MERLSAELDRLRTQEVITDWYVRSDGNGLRWVVWGQGLGACLVDDRGRSLRDGAMTRPPDKGTQVAQALRALADENARRGAARVMDEARARRDYDAEQRASALYEELRLLDREQLAERAGYDAPRQQLIAQIIAAETERIGPQTDP